MGTYQRTSLYETSGDVIRGSAAIEISPYQETPVWSAVGAQVGFTATRALETTEEEVDDAQSSLSIYKDEWDLAFDRFEILTEAVNEILFSFDSFTEVAGTLVSGATQVVASGAWAYKQFIPIANQNGSGGAITINSVTGGTDEALTADTDYYLGQNDAGTRGIFIIDSETVTTLDQSITIDYDYTPSESYYETNNAASTAMPNIMVRARADNDAGKQMEITWYKCQMQEAGEWAFQSDNSEDRRLRENLSFRAKVDSTYQSDLTFKKEIGESLF